jgi:hypothetical protein
VAEIYIDPKDWNRFAAQCKAYDKALYTAVRKRIRNAGDIAKDRVKAALAESPPSGGGSSVGSRAALSAATKTSLSFAAKTAGVKITTSGSGLGAGHAGFEKAYNKASFRHPVYGSRNAWASQEGRPYFGVVIEAALNKEILDEIQSAIDDAADVFGGF